MKKLMLLLAVFAISCNPFENISEVKKREEALRNPRFKELPEGEMYAFLNEVYLPRLHTSVRNLYIHPTLFTPKAVEPYTEPPEVWYKSSSTWKIRPVKPRVIIEPEIGIDSTYSWEQLKLYGIDFITQNEFDYYNREHSLTPSEFEVFKKKFKSGFKTLSKPKKDVKTGEVIFLEQHFDSFWWCGTDRERIRKFLKTDSGWVQLR